MSNNLFSHVSEEPKIQKSDKNDNPEKCGKDYYPCCITNNASIKCLKGCEQQLDGRSCDDCLWICFPMTITLDIILFIPETICYIYNNAF